VGDPTPWCRNVDRCKLGAILQGMGSPSHPWVPQEGKNQLGINGLGATEAAELDRIINPDQERCSMEPASASSSCFRRALAALTQPPASTALHSFSTLPAIASAAIPL
jgi:hypothetical protein